jgi:hypothetical protein
VYCARHNKYTLDRPQFPPSLLDATHLALALPLQVIIALERDTRHETQYTTLLYLNPIPHQLRQFLRPSLSLHNKLHPRRSPIVPDTVLGGVPRCRLKDKRGAEIIQRRDPHLPVIVKCVTPRIAESASRNSAVLAANTCLRRSIRFSF